MSYAKSRSALGELHLGMVEGGHKLVVQDRGGEVDPATYEARRDLADVWHGIHESLLKTAPDGIVATTPTYVPNPPASPSAV